jgi:drug/metabolite transporter (DMT)-like permease
MKRLATSTPVLIGGLWVIWSTVFIAIKLGLNYSTPAAFILFRVLVALVLLGFVLIGSSALRQELSSPRAHRAGVVLGLSTIAGFMILHTLGMESAGVGVASVLIYTQPLLVALGAAWMLGERLSPRQALGVLAGWAGVCLIVAEELDVDGTPPRAIGLLLASAVCWALGTLSFKRIGMVASPWVIVFLACVYGLPPLLIFAGLADFKAQMNGMLIVSVLWAALGIVGGYGLQFMLLGRGKAGVVSSWIFPVPIFASLLGVVFLDELLRVGLAVGALTVAVGIYLVNVEESGTP